MQNVKHTISIRTFDIYIELDCLFYVALFKSTIDNGYHVNYTKERQLWQDVVIRSVIRITPRASPWIVYTCGPMVPSFALHAPFLSSIS
jgi:hypothetical protein